MFPLVPATATHHLTPSSPHAYEVLQWGGCLPALCSLQNIVWCQILIQKCLFCSIQVLTLATWKAGSQTTQFNLCDTQLGLEMDNVISRKCFNLLWDFCSSALFVNCTYAWIWWWEVHRIWWWEVYRILLFLKQN